ncbi:MAG: hypothetical protein F4018_08150 [Acidobacteria bacterium]|nr:hypothetical protein [Acidobacteriota bacterium]
MNNTKTTAVPCDQCPWRISNHGKRHPGGFYRKDNLRRLWNQIRKGGRIQSCHPTDPSHADHRKYAGAKPGATPLECVGSVILVLREVRYADTLDGDTTTGTLSVTDGKRYLAETRQRKGLTREGFLYHGFARALPRPLGDGAPLPEVDEKLLDSPAYGRPDEPPLLTAATAKREPAATAARD